MFEKVNPAHPDKVADRIAGAIVDLAYEKEENPKVAAEVLIGHRVCTVIVETSVKTFTYAEIDKIVERIAGKGIELILKIVSQDKNLSKNQEEAIRCGDNGIFKGMPKTNEQEMLSKAMRAIYSAYPTDGKQILAGKDHIICQSCCSKKADTLYISKEFRTIVNPLGYWTGGTNVDSGATNRKLGSDMGDAVTGGGLHGKDLSKADVSVNIYAHLKAQETGKPVELYCAIGDDTVDGKPYSEIVEIAREYIQNEGGFEKFAEWGLI